VRNGESIESAAGDSADLNHGSAGGRSPGPTSSSEPGGAPLTYQRYNGTHVALVTDRLIHAAGSHQNGSTGRRAGDDLPHGGDKTSVRDNSIKQGGHTPSDYRSDGSPIRFNPHRGGRGSGFVGSQGERAARSYLACWRARYSIIRWPKASCAASLGVSPFAARRSMARISAW
jgi:hypothetical protein